MYGVSELASDNAKACARSALVTDRGIEPTIKKIFELLTGDKYSEPLPKIREKLLERIIILNGTDVRIVDEKGSFEGKFLRLRCTTDEGSKRTLFRYEGPPALFLYSESNSRMMNIDTGWLCILNRKKSTQNRGSKLVPDSLDNIKLKAYFAWRVHLLPRYMTSTHSSKQGTASKTSNIIRFENDDPRRRGAYELLGIDTTHANKRKNIEKYIDAILENYKAIGAIRDYEIKQEEKPRRYVSVELDCISKKNTDAPNKNKLFFVDNDIMETLREGKQELRAAGKKVSLDAFDMLILNAVISLDKSSLVKITPGRIFTLLCGDKNAKLRLSERKLIIERIDKLRRTKMKAGSLWVKLLPLEKVSEGSYRYRAVSIASINAYPAYNWLKTKSGLKLSDLDILIYDACVRIIRIRSKSNKGRQIISISEMAKDVTKNLCGGTKDHKKIEERISELFRMSVKDEKERVYPLFCTDGKETFLRPKIRKSADEPDPFYYVSDTRHRALDNNNVISVASSYLLINDKNGKKCVHDSPAELVLKSYIACLTLQAKKYKNSEYTVTIDELTEAFDMTDQLIQKKLPMILKAHKRKGSIIDYKKISDGNSRNKCIGYKVSVLPTKKQRKTTRTESKETTD